ncbi:transforming growth factor-beta-induced protein ig-h3-like [Crassostrea virginica]|uniref:Periostin-like n=1 Tax=Crassostrea virginica TaxID=6565 RepID=A0A8B8DFD1_CRAVI|nr:periostin-like [Crassostrea virginica]
MKLLLVLSVCFAVSAAYPNLVDLAQANGATKLVELLTSAGLADILRDPTQGPFTLLAPSDGAFAKVPADALQGLKTDNAKLQEVLKYHVMKGEIFEWDLQNHEVIPSLNGHSIRVYVRTSSVNQTTYFNQAKVIISELQASNGVLYLIDEVLNMPEGTIDDIIMNPDYSINNFMDFIKEAKLTEVFNRTVGARYTMFVPTNQALASLDQGFLTQIKNSYVNSRHLVDYHVHPGTLHGMSIVGPGRLTTMYRGHYIGLSQDSNNNTLLNNVASIVQADIEAEDGVVHIISHVLIPSTLSPSGIGGIVG